MAKDNSEKRAIEKIIALIDRESEISEQRIKALYDGVLGVLPDWAPDWHKQEFIRIRDRLLSQQIISEYLNPDQIVKFMDIYRDWGDETKIQGFIPREIQDDIGQLAHYRYAVSLGEFEGRKLLSDQDAVEGRKIQKQRSNKGKQSGVTRSEQRDERNKRIVAYVRTLAGNFDRGEWAKRAARNFKCSEVTARKAIREGGLYEIRQVVKRKKIKKID